MKRVERTIRYKKKVSFLDTIQYILAIIITICFGIGLIPKVYWDVAPFIIVAIVIQIVISIIRLRLLNIFLELVILVLGIVSLIPILGFLFRFIGFFAALLEMASFKNYRIYKQIEIRTFDSMKKKTSKSKQIRKSKERVFDAEYEEK